MSYENKQGRFFLVEETRNVNGPDQCVLQAGVFKEQQKGHSG